MQRIYYGNKGKGYDKNEQDPEEGPADKIIHGVVCLVGLLIIIMVLLFNLGVVK
jgi:hypothetical protein